MCFELTEALIQDILFSMEDQQGDFLVDTQHGVVVRRDSLEAAQAQGRFRELPTWNPAAGYKLMKKFTARFKNPLVRTELTAALDRGRGVFRAFKDTLNQYPEAEKRWFAFKTQQMKQEILGWYNALRDEWGLEHIGSEPEETDDLVLEDFLFRTPKAPDVAAAAALHRSILQKTERIGRGEPEEPGNIALIAETGEGDFAGYIATVHKGDALYIPTVEVKAEYRGLGVGEALLSRLLDSLDPEALSWVFLDLPVEIQGFSRVLFRNAFTPKVTRYALALKPSPLDQHQDDEADKGQGDPHGDP
ncbi:MAG: GNAT family N-acetyltransferase [Spirochaetaceae bacterium]|jgi:GNAT superfamily N-acetyltransferase|nr:GNAT family N-acetyltransferase [Spirochaetaceae bacterium]